MKTERLNETSARALLDVQKKYFATGATRPLQFRLGQLETLYKALERHTPALEAALKQDLGKSRFESYASEIGMVLAGISHIRRHLARWMKPRTKLAPVQLFPGRSRVELVPYGCVYILGPYNYPVQLLLEPLAEALAAGNCAVVSPSELTPHVAEAVSTMLAEVFPPEYVCCVPAGIENNTLMLHSRFDYIFFTGSPRVGRIVMQAAAENLVPVTLELGGKSPVIVAKDAHLPTACERIVWGKLMNAGQTCVAPDYVLVDRSIQEEFLQGLEGAIRRFYGEDAQQSPDYGRIVNEGHIRRLSRILEEDRAFVRCGGRVDAADRYIEPTILCPDGMDAACMQEELFGPLLPVFAYDDLTEALETLNKGEKPLALYVFSQNKALVRRVLDSTASGGVSVNDTIGHILDPDLPFGGVGQSGMGAYHGHAGFLTFSHRRSVLHRGLFPMRAAFPPFSEAGERIVRRLMR